MYINKECSNKIELAQKVIDSDFENGFNKLYSFTTENIKDYISSFDLNNKSLLTVGSSADQAINAILNGCKDVTIMDINPFVKYYFNLKKAGILTLDYKKFMDYFFDYGLSPMLFSKDIYEKLRKVLSVLDLDSLLFWDNLYQNNNSKVIRYRLFKDDVMETRSLKKFNPYLSDEFTFKKTKKRIININPKFINGNILDADKWLMNCKFDNIFLSNIYDYVKDNADDLYRFRLIINYLIKNMNTQGKLMISYLYGINKTDSLVDFVHKFDYDKYNIEIFRGIRGLYFDDDTKDAIVTYRKTK